MRLDVLREAVQSICVNSFRLAKDRLLRKIDEVESRRAERNDRERLRLDTPEWRELSREAMRRWRSTLEGRRRSRRINRAYLARHPEAARRGGAKRRAIERDLFVEPRSSRVSILARTGGRCYHCGAQATAIDHLISLARGGPEASWNLLGICGSCNSYKRDKPLHALPDFLGGVPRIIVAMLLVHGFRYVAMDPSLPPASSRGVQ